MSPLPHIDPIGTILLPGLGIALGGWFFGWAKPVLVNPTNFTRRVSSARGMSLVAIAGPLSNVILAFLAASAMIVQVRLAVPQESFPFRFTHWLLVVNVFLAVFNLVPIPPLDGSRLLPQSPVRDFLERYSFIVFIAVFFLPLFGGRSLGSLFLVPLNDALTNAVVSLASVLFAG